METEHTNEISGNSVFTEQSIKSTKPNNIYCNLMIIDNFYTNAMSTRDYILTQEFKVRGNYPGQRTISYANNQLKEIIEGTKKSKY